MNDEEVQADGIVRTALQQLPVPPHLDDFWVHLDRALAGEPAPSQPTGAVSSVFIVEADPDTKTEPVPAATEPAPAHDPSLALVPPALRRPSNAILVVVAAAAMVAVALAGNALLDERSGRGAATPPNRSRTTAELDALVEDAQPVDATPRTMPADGEAASSGAVLAWVEHLRAGAADDAWAAMGTVSQAHFGSQADFEAQLSALAEGYGNWSEIEPEQVLVTPVSDGDEGILAVVTLVGTVTLEGDRQRRAEAFPVRFLDGEARVEPFASAGELEVITPEGTPGGSSPAVGSGEELVVVVPSGVGAPLLRLDDGAAVVCGAAEVTELAPLDDAPGQRCAYLPEGGISAGEHTFTVAFSSAGGAEISAQSMLFDAA